MDKAALLAKDHVVPFDTWVWEPYFSTNERMELYYEGLQKAKIEWTDNFSKQNRYFSMQQMLHHVLKKGLMGDVAECGCWKGHSTYIISKILTDFSFSGKFHVFDSFEGGLSNKNPEDKNLRKKQTEESIQKEKEMFASTIEELKASTEGFDFIEIYKGWIPERFHEVDQNQFIFVHLDVDLYQPTLDSLKFFFPRLLKGGVIVLDDYALTQFPGAKKAVEEFLETVDVDLFYEVPLGSCFLIK